MATKTFSVTGMTCDNCVHHVTEAISAVPGVKKTEVSLANNSASVEGDFDEAAVMEAVKEEGYEAAVKS